MTKRLHTKSKIFFPNPYVVRLDHDTLEDANSSVFRAALKLARKNIHGTWGYCNPEMEYIGVVSPAEFNSMSSANQLNALFSPAEGKMRSYWCFADEMDALQFRLSVGISASHVNMWPARFFTIYEIADSE